MLVLGDRKRAALGAGQAISFIEADAMRLPFPANSFQLVTVAFGLRNIVDTDAGLAEMVRVCRPAGRVAVLEFSHPPRQPMKSLYGFYFRRVLPLAGRLLAKSHFSAYSYLPASVGEFPSGGALAERMRTAGLAAVEVVPLTLGVATLYIGTKTNRPPAA
jgi:demethylmenaquinone methyltransferase/2-methoxy-6-polyprenyl-1,4-benzoquinol methylase